MTSANTYLGPKKARPASLVGHLQNSRREVGNLLRLLNQIPQFTLSARRMSRLHVLAAF